MLECVLDLPPAVEPLHLGGLTAGSKRVRHLAKMLLRRRSRVSWGRLRRMQPVSDDWGLSAAHRLTASTSSNSSNATRKTCAAAWWRFATRGTRVPTAAPGSRGSDVLDINSQNR